MAAAPLVPVHSMSWTSASPRGEYSLSTVGPATPAACSTHCTLGIPAPQQCVPQQCVWIRHEQSRREQCAFRFSARSRSGQDDAVASVAVIRSTGVVSAARRRLTPLPEAAQERRELDTRGIDRLTSGE